MIRLRNRRFMRPTERTMKRYARLLCQHLDAFIGDELPKRHSVIVHPSYSSATIILAFAESDAGEAQVDVCRDIGERPIITYAGFYFAGNQTYFEKPMKRNRWTKDQAWLDASEVIAATLSAKANT